MRDIAANPGIIATAASVTGVLAAKLETIDVNRARHETTVRNGISEEATPAPVESTLFKFENQLSTCRRRGGAAKLVPANGEPTNIALFVPGP
jgi:hypothetical protein